MATPSMQQFCMGTSDWFKAIVSEAADAAGSMDNSNSSSPSATELICTRPPPPPPAFERRLRPPHDQALKCPRCDSTHTKFCYYNNYSLSQPRYFCKTCRRYWTKGGSLRNVPVGGGCRKNKRSAAKRSQPTDHHHHIATQVFPHGHQSTDLQLSNLNFMFEGSSHLFTSSCCDIGLGAGHLGLSMINGGQHGSIAEACQRLALPFEAQEEEEEAAAAAAAADTAKVGNSRMLSLEWPDQGCGEYSYGYGGAAIGVWAGMIGGGHGPSSAAM